MIDTERPRLVTVLFTDVVGSTALRQRVGDDRADGLQRRTDDAVAAVVDEHRGWVVKGLGDGTLAAFAGAADAVDAAASIQRTGRGIGVDLRVGLSAGDVAWDDDGDCRGTPVVEAARLCDAAATGQILATEVVRSLAGSRTAAEMASYGDLDLKGLERPLATVEVQWRDDGIGATGVPPALRIGSVGPFVGRSDHLRTLTTAVEKATAAEPSVVLVAGEPGIGKTRLVAELARRAATENGALVLYGRCDEDAGIPNQPFVEALAGHAAVDASPALGAQPAELKRLVPDLAVDGEPVRDTPGTERTRFFRAVTSWLSAAGGERPVVLVLDDLHWAGKPTLLLLRHLVRSLDGQRLVVVGTYRDTDVDRRHPLGELIGDLRREPRVERVSVKGLDGSALVDWLVEVGGHDLDELGEAFATALLDATDGNPFFVREVLLHLTATGALYQRDGRWTSDLSIEDLGIPEGVRDAVGRRLSSLGDETNDVLAAASVLGLEFAFDVLSDLVAGSLGEGVAVDRALDEAESAQMIEQTSDRPLQFRFAHALGRATLLDEIPTLRKVTLHLLAAESLVARRPGAEADHAAEIARHYVEAAVGGDVESAIDWAVRAGHVARHGTAYEEAAHWFGQAVDLMHAAGARDTARRADTLFRLGQAQVNAGDEGSVESLRRAVDAALDAGEPVLAARAELAGFFGYGTDESRIERIDRILAALAADETGRRASLLAAKASEEAAADRTQAADTAEAALALGDDVDDPVTRTLVESWVVMALQGYRGATDRELELAERACDRADELGVAVLRLLTAMTKAATLSGLWRWFELESHLAAVAPLVDEVGSTVFRFQHANMNASAAIFDGRLDEAEQWIRRSRAAEPASSFISHMQLAFLRWVQDRPADEALEWAEEIDNSDGRADVYLARLRGRPAAEVAELWLARSPRLQGLFAHHHLEYCAENCDAAMAQRLLDAYDEVREEWGSLSERSWSRYPRGRLLLAMGRHDEAVTEFEGCCRHATEEYPSALLQPIAELALVEALVARDGPGDRDRAREILGPARERAERIGSHRYPRLAGPAIEALGS